MDPPEFFTSTHFEGGDPFLSPDNLSTFDECAANPQFLKLQEELRSILFTGAASLAPTRALSPELSEPSHRSEAVHARPGLVLTTSSIPTKKLIKYLQNWIKECAPWLDMFDQARHFGIQVPLLAQESPALLYGILALSA